MRGSPSSESSMPPGAEPAGVLVRRCTEADLRALEASEPPGSGYARGAFARQEAGLVDFLVALVDEVTLGSAELTHDEPPELKNLGVEPEARGRGVGTALIAAAESLVAERRTAAGVAERALVVGVGVDNTRAAALYERLGYERTGVLSTTTYTFVDAAGMTQTVTERDEELIKRW